MTYYIATELKDVHYLFAADSQGELPLFTFLHQKKPEHYPSSSVQEAHSILKILSDLDEIITLESLYDPTNWEVLFLSEPLRDIFGFSALYYKDFYPQLLNHLVVAYFVHVEDSGHRYSLPATWMAQEPKPLIQRICAQQWPESISNRCFLSGDLCRLFRLLGRRGIDEKKYYFAQVTKVLSEFLKANPQVVDPENPSLYRVGHNALANLGNSQTIHHSQFQPLLQFHCRPEPYFSQKCCKSCNALLY